MPTWLRPYLVLNITSGEVGRGVGVKTATA
jgi:hypothetical protein